MYVKVLFVILVAILGGFFYLHYQNPATATVLVYKEYAYTLPIVFFLFISFFLGLFFAVANGFVTGTTRSIKGFRKRRRQKEKEAEEADYQSGMRHLARGETVAARTYISKSIKAHPSDTSLVVSLARSYLKEKRAEEALGALETGLASNPGSISLLVSIGETALRLGDKVKAAWAFEEVLSHDATNPASLRELRIIHSSEARWHEATALQQRIVEAVTAVGRGSTKDTSKARTREERLYACLLFESAQLDFKDAKQNEAAHKLSTVLKFDPTLVGAHLLMGEVTVTLSGLGAAIKGWEKALGLCPRSHAILLRIEDAYIKEARPEDALERYKERIATNPGDKDLRVILARLYLKLEMVDNAIEELESLHGNMVENSFTRSLLGTAYMRHGRIDDAAGQFMAALGIEGGVVAPFTCASCTCVLAGYKSRCPECGEWNSLRLSASSLEGEKEE
jgi:predicted Zn-dependent protease